MTKIYISSTFRDLKQHRSEVYQRLRSMRLDVVSMEDYTASGRPPLEKCIEDASSCEIYVGIFGFRHGYVPDGKKRSITEFELEAARSAGRTCLIFLMDDDAPIPAKHIDRDRSAIDRLRAELEKDFVVEYFMTADELAAAVSVAVANALSEASATERETETTPEHSQQTHNFYRRTLRVWTNEYGRQINFFSICSAVLLALGTGLAAAGLGRSFAPLGVGGLVVGSTTIFPVLSMLSVRRRRTLLKGYQSELEEVPPAAEALRQIQDFIKLRTRSAASES